MRNLKSFSMVVPLALSTVGVINTAHAAQLEEIVVTAEFRENNVQDTPLAITALSAEMLDQRGITDVGAIGRLAPNVNISNTGAVHGPAAAVYIRGVGQFDSNAAFEPGVGMYVDDVYLGSMTGTFMDLLDLERVEVLRGPQGTLSGKNSIGGAVKLFSQKPEGDGTGYVEFTIGEDNKKNIRAAYDTSLTDNLFMRISGMSKQQDGHVTILDYGCANPGSGIPATSVRLDCKTGTLGGKDLSGFRAAFRWLASEDIEVNFSVDTVEDDSEMGAFITTRTDVDPRFISPSTYANYSDFKNPDTDEVFPNISAVDSTNFALTVDWSISDRLTLKSITAYRDLDAEFTNDQDSIPYTSRLNYNDQSVEQFTQEIRLSGVSANDAIDWTVGAFYYDSEGNLKNRIASSAAFNFFNDDVVTSKSKSVFGHAIWHINDKTNLTAGIRYTDDEKNYLFRQVGADGVTPTFQNGLTANYSGTNTDVRLGLDYQLSDNMMAYGQYSTGYKGGGTNPRLVNITQAQPHNPEYIDAFELGLKSDLLDGSMRLNASLFFNEYSDIILTNSAACCVIDGNPIPPGPPFAILPFNGGNADVKGLELEMEWAVTDNLMVNASYSILDFEYTDILQSDIININIPADGITPYTAENQWALGASYLIELAGGSTLTPRFDITYQDEVFSEPNNAPTSAVDDFTLMNARLAWLSSDETWQATLAVDNLTDEVYYPASFDAVTFSGTVQKIIGRPREISFTIRRNF